MSHQATLLIRHEMMFPFVARETSEQPDIFLSKHPLPGYYVSDLHRVGREARYSRDSLELGLHKLFPAGAAHSLKFFQLEFEGLPVGIVR